MYIPADCMFMIPAGKEESVNIKVCLTPAELWWSDSV